MSNPLLSEKYRPLTVKDCILPDAIKSTFQSIVNDDNLPNLLLTGTAGLGKTTIAKALCNEMGLDYRLINASEDGGIDVLRTKIKKFASSVSLSGGKYKVVILDEADYLNPQSTQPALRGFIEEFSSNCRFILTCNFKDRIIAPLHSRCSVIEFNTGKKELAGLAEKFMHRLQEILSLEGIKYDQRTIAEIIIKFAPDWRRVLNECQRHSAGGTITPEVLLGSSDQNITSLVSFLKGKDFKSMRAWVTNNIDLDPSVVFRKLYDVSTSAAEPSSIPQLVLILADYQYKNAFAADKEINTVACLTEIMGSVTWKN